MGMDEAIIKSRDMIVEHLTEFMGTPIVLSDELEPMNQVPYGYYSFITPYVSSEELGVITYLPIETEGVEDDSKQLRIRSETAEMGLSFNFCSYNRQQDDKEINGETEALGLATRAVGWFKHEGDIKLGSLGLVVLSVHNLANRSAILGDNMIRRWGFDVTLRYKAQTALVEDILILGKTIQEEQGE